jgi:hypothetical protein
MKYWGYFGAKLVACYFCVRAIWDAVRSFLPKPARILNQPMNQFPQDLVWTSALFFVFLVGVVLFYVIVEDQRGRCRTCLRRLRMPLEQGSWSRATLFAPPRIESICPYGHGTLSEEEVQITGLRIPEWRANGDDLWKELESIDRPR